MRKPISLFSGAGANGSARLRLLVGGRANAFCAIFLDAQRPASERLLYDVRLSLVLVGYLLTALLIYALILIPFTSAISDLLMHPALMAGAWVGFNDGRIAFRSHY